MTTMLTTNAKLVAGALALTLGLAGAAAAQPGVGRGPGGPDGPGRGGRGMMGGPLGGLLAVHPDLPLSALSLTDAQREQVRTILQSHRDEGRAVHEKANAAMEALRKATEGTVDEGSVAQQGQILGAAIGEAAVLRARVRTEVFAILTPEQQAEATRIAAQRQAHMQQRRQQAEQRRQQRQAQPKK
jgi:Spy/CpxP family protein refolding chaperone